ncbi:hypothetical protein ACPOL_7082 (plasmid) [Acidisarcina polymorpha]|uniref:Uncharacterized protein n=1 Tax=Acidisarcina polymorpha TaxID=2211140 RepID=A0A2Z5GC26_9BACT|nr:hypothetical protein ACPOL_7082 [Acidisarcina polymorpha]
MHYEIRLAGTLSDAHHSLSRVNRFSDKSGLAVFQNLHGTFQNLR